MKVTLCAAFFLVLAIVWFPLVLMPARPVSNAADKERCMETAQAAFESRDTDHDGFLSVEEFVAGAEPQDTADGEGEAKFTKLDANHDGRLTLAEYLQGTGESGKRPRRAATPL